MVSQSLPSEMEKELENIISAALTAAEVVGFGALDRNNTSTVSGCSENIVRHYFKTDEELTQAVMYAAIENERLQILAQGVALENKVALQAPKALIDKSLIWIARQAWGLM